MVTRMEIKPSMEVTPGSINRRIKAAASKVKGTTKATTRVASKMHVEDMEEVIKVAGVTTSEVIMVVVDSVEGNGIELPPAL